MSHSIENTRRRNPMWVYEHNYALLAHLFPALLAGDRDRETVEAGAGRLELRVVERCPYTLMVEVAHFLAGAGRWAAHFRMRVRVYRDARLGEVVECQDSGRLLPEYPWPNARMFHRDEKHQANRLLREWLFVAWRERRPSPAAAGA